MAPPDVDLHMWRIIRRSSDLGVFTFDKGTFDSAQSKVKFGEFSEAQPGAKRARQWQNPRCAPIKWHIRAESSSNGSCRITFAVISSELSPQQMGVTASA